MQGFPNHALDNGVKQATTRWNSDRKKVFPPRSKFDANCLFVHKQFVQRYTNVVFQRIMNDLEGYFETLYQEYQKFGGWKNFFLLEFWIYIIPPGSVPYSTPLSKIWFRKPRIIVSNCAKFQFIQSSFSNNIRLQAQKVSMKVERLFADTVHVHISAS